MNSKKIISIILLIFVLLLIGLSFVYYFRLRIISPKISVPYPKSTSQPEDNQLITTDVVDMPVILDSFEITDTITYAMVHLDRENVNNQFKIIVGATKGNMQTGTCLYDASVRTYTGNNRFILSSTADFVNKVQRNDKVMLRFSLTNEDYSLKVKSHINEVLKNGTLADPYNMLAPHSICIAST